MTPRQRDRRDRLIDAAIALLGTDDYERVQVKDVADQAGVSLGTLYSYFYSKERLFAEALVRWADNLPANIRTRPLPDAAPDVRLAAAVHRALRAFERSPQMARLVNVLLMSPDPLAGELMDRLGRATDDAYLQALFELDTSTARTIVDVVNAVFSVNLREWSLGRVSMREVHDRLDAAITLVVR
jgi:AcrR family transcriptional regulator